MAKKCAVIAATAERWRFQLAVLSALINYRNVSTMEQYSSQKANSLDFPLASDLNASNAQSKTLRSSFSLGNTYFRDILSLLYFSNTTGDYRS